MITNQYADNGVTIKLVISVRSWTGYKYPINIDGIVLRYPLPVISRHLWFSLLCKSYSIRSGFIVLLDFDITGSPAVHSRVNGVRRSSAETWNFNPSPKSQCNINWFYNWRGWLSYGDHQPCQIWFGSDERPRHHCGGNIYESCDCFCIFCLFVFFVFFNRATAHAYITMIRFSRTIAQTTQSGVKKTLLGWEMCSCEIWWCLTLKPP